MIIEKTMKKTNYSKPDIVVVKRWDDRQFMPTGSGRNNAHGEPLKAKKPTIAKYSNNDKPL